MAIVDTLRIATYNASLTRSGPGLLLRAIEKGTDAQVANVVSIIQHVRPDILLLNEFDYDVEGRASAAFRAALNSGPNAIDYPHSFSSEPNTGTLSGFDLNDDGNIGGPQDAFGYGTFPGQYGMLLLSKLPIGANPRTFSKLRWKDLPQARLPKQPDGGPYPSQDAQDILRLSSKSHWDIPIETPNGTIQMLASHPTPPVFDGPEDRNGLRNADEIRFWTLYLNGEVFVDDNGHSAKRTDGPAIVLGDLNADQNDGDGIHASIEELLTHPALADPKPESRGAAEAGQMGAANANHDTPPALDTADWNDNRGPGNLRVDYVLPTRDLTVTDAGVFWPAPSDPLHSLLGSGKSTASDHRLVWIDIDWQ